MDDILLSYYNRELSYVRKLGAEFSERYPKIAGRLRLDKDLVEDPHVSRLIESFAFLTARIRHSLDDSFPELTEALMGILYPDYHTPLPSMSITQFSATPNLLKKTVIPKGEKLKIETLTGDLCYYKTCNDISVLPIKIESANFYSLPVKAPVLPGNIQRSRSAQSLLKLKITPLEPGSPFDLDDDTLRFYINSQPDIAFKLQEYLSRYVIGVAIARDVYDDQPLFLSADAFSSSSCFVEDTVVELFDGRASSAHRLLTEYFLLPQKFLFTELKGVSQSWGRYANGFEIYIYLDQIDIDLVRGVDKNTFALGCVPIINLFESTVEPIQAAELGGEVMLRIAGSQARLMDVYQIKDVYAINAHGQKKRIPPFYGKHLSCGNFSCGNFSGGNHVDGKYMNEDDDTLYWSLRRENSSWQRGLVSHGTDTYLNFVDSNYTVISPDSNWVICAAVSCTNRDLPNKLPFGPDQPRVSFSGGESGLAIRCLIPATPTIQPKLNETTRWQLITQLSLQHFSGQDGLSILKEMLRLYNFNGSKEVSSLIDGIIQLDTEVMTARILDKGRSAMCQGTGFVLTCDESFYMGNSLYLFGSVIDMFISQFCAINTFTQLSIKTTKNLRVELEWPRRVGCQPLV